MRITTMKKQFGWLLLFIVSGIGIDSLTPANRMALAGDQEYSCKIDHIYNLQDIGSLEEPSIITSSKEQKREYFEVSKETGAISGKGSTLDTKGARSTSVISQGSSENSFVAVADFGTAKSGVRAYRIIKIEEYRKGSAKPFVAMSDLAVLTGTCK